MNAETYLDQVKKLDSMIRNRRRDYARRLEEADGLGGATLGERVQASRNLHRGADAICHYIDLEREIAALERERDSIIKTIEQLPSVEYDVIYKLYVGDYDKDIGLTHYYTLKEVAYHFGRSYDWAKDHRKMGLTGIQALLDAKTKQECEQL